jgi:hypothetical protein
MIEAATSGAVNGKTFLEWRVAAAGARNVPVWDRPQLK